LRRIFLSLVIAGWLVGITFGLSRLWTYQNTAGIAAQAPHVWPVNTPIDHNSTQPALVMFIHPQCPCSRATIEELNRLMAVCHDKMTCTVLMIHPAGTPDHWDHTDLWKSATAIPGVKVMSDPEGVESRRFGSMTSGQTLLYSAEGRLLFAGGITASRGHNGDNAGRTAIASLILDPETSRARSFDRTAVYGCPLFNPSPTILKTGARKCPD